VVAFHLCRIGFFQRRKKAGHIRLRLGVSDPIAGFQKKMIAPSWTEGNRDSNG
jgi:hypothetical protein